MNKNILGINMSCLDTSVCLMGDGEIKFAVREERLNREKRTRKFPVKALKMALDYGNLTLKDIDEIGISWNPAINLERHIDAQSSLARYKPEHFYSVPSYLFTLLEDEDCLQSGQEFYFGAPSDRIRIKYLNHHLCHAAEAFYLSKFDEALVLVMDAYGEKESICFYRADKNGLEKIGRVLFPNSLGSFYGTITQFLGFVPDSDEWKVMGASAYGDPKLYYPQLMELFKFTGDYNFEIDQSYFYYPLFTRSCMYSPRLVEILGQPRRESDELTQRHYDIAAGAQKVLETVVFKILKGIFYKEGFKNLCLSGGVGMNCVMNGKVLRNTPFESIFISSAPDDGGTSVGAAIYLNQSSPKAERKSYQNNYWGPSATKEDIKKLLQTYNLRYEILKNPGLTATKLISEDKIIGWFQGRMEFGERALGNRSILASPKKAEMKDKINHAVKFREHFRPFAPTILEDHINNYFVEGENTPFMEKVFQVRPGKRSEIEAVTHIDGTARLQTLNRNQNSRYYDLIHEFYKLSGTPAVLNTSFNLRGEPIVAHPEHAIRTFFTSGMDALIIDDFLILK